MKSICAPICSSADIAPMQARAFAHDGVNIIIWRQGQNLRGFVNACPHLGTPLEIFANRLLDDTGTMLVCATHGARFNAHGTCISGPCVGDALAPLPLAEADGKIMLAQTPKT